MRRNKINFNLNFYTALFKQVFVLSCFLLFLIFSITPASAASASLYLVPSSGTYVINGTFNVGVKVNSDGAVINAAQGTINFDNKILEVTGTSKGGSIFSLWTTDPTFSNAAGTINFGGGVPNPGYNGTAGHIFTVTFKAKKIGTAQVRFSAGAVLANDGKGTNILASMGSASYTISPKVDAPPPTERPQPRQEPDYNKPVITSPTHPDSEKWYNSKVAKFTWEPPVSVTGVSIGFDKETFIDPGPASDGLFSNKEYGIEGDGVWYLHLKYKDRSRWGTVAHYKIMSDMTPPLPFEIEVKENDGDWPELIFKAEDETSGIDHYEVLIGALEGGAQIVEAEKAVFKVIDIEIGEHQAIVKAIDKAGNETISVTTFLIGMIEAPVIKNYPKELRSADNFYMNGTALPNAIIIVFITSDGKPATEGSVNSDSKGNWFYINEDSLSNGRYVAWAEAINDKGLKSGPSNKISFLVTPPVFTQLGSFVINYFTVLVSLLFMILLIILLILLIIWLIRRKLKKETKDIEQVVHKNLNDLKSTIDTEFKGLDKLSGPSRVSGRKKAKERMKKNVDIAEKKIIKEIKDVEDILK